jgi:hypothetical protein
MINHSIGTVFVYGLPLVDPLTLVIILSLFNLYINIISQSSLQLGFFYYLWFCIVNLSVDRLWSCWVIYYFDTPALGRRHQLFDRVKFFDVILR